MPYNKKSLLNLKRTPKGVSGNPAGRQKNLATTIKSIPPDAREKVYSTLHHAISLPNVKEAKRYLESDDVQQGLGDYGFVLQIVLKAMIGKDGWLTVCDILDRLWGKPKQTTQLSGGISVGDKPVIMFASETQAPEEEQSKEECHEE